MTALPLLAAVAGPTGSGKSELAIHLAHHLDGEVINCDSLQLFKFFDVGTAKLRSAEWQGVPHHLIDYTTPDHTVSAGEYSRVARAIATEIAGRRRTPVVAGGTGFYLRALLEGLSPAPERDVRLRARLTEAEERRAGVLFRLLRRVDPPSAARIHANDRPKLIRAIEIGWSGPGTASTQPERTPLEGFTICKIGLFPPRDELYRRLDRSCEAMFAHGLIEECESILARGYAASAKPFEAIGYVQALAVIEGKLSRQDALADMQMQTRRYAKRQLTWFRRDPGVHRVEGFGSDAATQQAALRIIGEINRRGH